jgi:hypothetical protein
MADLFGNYKLAINHPDYFFGRKDIIYNIVNSPFEVRVILGERRLGKTSTLNAIRWSLLEVKDSGTIRALPILIDLQQEQPTSLDNFRYILIERLRETILNPQQEKCLLFDLRQTYRRFLRQIEGASVNFFDSIELNVVNPDRERLLIHEDFSQDLVNIIQKLQTSNCQGVCFLLDGAEYLVKQSWVNDAWSYLRSLKDTNNIAIQSFLGLVVAGYRDLKDYHQQIGSPLFNIAEITWLGTLSTEDIKELIQHRCEVAQCDAPDDFIARVIELGGCHPFFTNQFLNACFKNLQTNPPLPTQQIERKLIKELRKICFEPWWKNRFSPNAKNVYLILLQGQQSSLEDIEEKMEDLSLSDIEDALEILAGSGVIRKVDSGTYRLGAGLFAQWVREELKHSP